MNELILVDKIEKRLQEQREPPVFPLAANHRKELRKLRDDNIGNLRGRLKNIETLKREEYQKKYTKQIEKELEQYVKVFNNLNDDWKERIGKINKILDERKQLEENQKVNNLSINQDYGELSNLEKINPKREFSLNKKQKALEIAKEEFEKKYGDKFNDVEKKIDNIVTHYEEAINFGDLEIVKKLYYMMKKSDSFFIKVSELKV